MALRIEPYVELIPGYRLIERLGGGGFGEVWKAEAPGGFAKAIKIIHGDIHRGTPDEMRHAEQELLALKRVQSIRHPFLLSLERYDIVEGRLLIVMELADCNLWDYFGECVDQGHLGIPREELLGYLEEVAEVLDLMNDQHGLQHLDIKPQNLFLLHRHAKVADFGLVKDLSGGNAVASGGVTPVYAAPETFDGRLSRTCDQYSLAIVYQELLTGQRPFVGTTIKDLLTQHMEVSPELSSLPETDRPAVARALSKRTVDRFPSCLEFVRALQRGTVHQQTRRAEAPGSVRRAVVKSNQLPETPRGEAREGSATLSGSMSYSKLYRTAAPEAHGTGVLLPAVIVGLGRAGTEVLCRFRAQLTDRLGSFERLGNLQLLAIDTDPQTLQDATDPATTGALAREEVFAARLNRTGYYLQARRNGRSLIEGWCDPQILYRIPRNLTTAGIRALGRLAFADHYRAINTALITALSAATDPAALEQADRETRLGFRTNQPRIYVVAHLGGGTGSGMFIDLAYTVRHRMHQMGYQNPQIIGLFVLPPMDRTPEGARATSNAFAALTELYHFSHPATSFSGGFDDRCSFPNDPNPPFTHCVILGSPAEVETSERRLARLGAEFLQRELTTAFGRHADTERERYDWLDQSTLLKVSSFGVSSYNWPRPAALALASSWLTRHRLRDWLGVGAQGLALPEQEWWDGKELTTQSIADHFYAEAERAWGEAPQALFDREAKAFSSRSLFSRGPDPAKLWDTLGRLQKLLGLPDTFARPGGEGQAESFLAETGTRFLRDVGSRLTDRLLALLERPAYRLAGAEQIGRDIQRSLRRATDRGERDAREQAEAAAQAHLVLNCVLSPEKGRRISAKEVAENLRIFAYARFEALVLRQAIKVSTGLANRIDDLLRDLELSRRRLSDLSSKFERLTPHLPAAAETDLLPPGCGNLEEFTQKLFESLTPAHLAILDQQIQEGIEGEFGSLYRACMNSSERLDDLGLLLFRKAHAFLDHELGETDVVEMFFHRFPTTDQAIAMIQRAYQAAEPSFVASEGEVCLLGIPKGERAQPFQLLACRALAGIDVTPVAHTDELLFYRETPTLSLHDLPHLGPDAAEAYLVSFGSDSSTPHTRHDITDWLTVEV